MPKRQIAFKVAFVAMVVWGLIEIGLAVREHGWLFDRHLNSGLTLAAFGFFMLVWGGRQFPAAKS